VKDFKDVDISAPKIQEFIAGFGAIRNEINKAYEFSPNEDKTEPLFCPRCHFKMIYMGKGQHFWRCVSPGCVVKHKGHVRYTELWPAEESPLEREKREKAAREEFEGRRFVNSRGGELLPTGYVPGKKKGGKKAGKRVGKKRLKMEKFYPVLEK
jgi:DNA-directed RNA polymerase subunit RPC12/RpoP